jgi:hypothetical protein
MLKIPKKGRARLMSLPITKFQAKAFITLSGVFDSRSAPTPR